MSTEWITWDEAAAIAGCSRSGLYRYVQSGHIRHRDTRARRGSLERSSVEEFAVWLASERVERAQRRATRKQRISEPIGPPDDGDVWLGLPTVALMLGRSEQWVGRLASQERIPAARRGHRWWLRRLDVEIYVAGRAFQRRLVS